MINVPGEALFDLLDSRIATIRDSYNYRNYIIKIGNEDRDWTPDDEYSVYSLEISKGSFMKLLLDRVFICDEYELKIEL